MVPALRKCEAEAKLEGLTVQGRVRGTREGFHKDGEVYRGDN